LDRHKKNVDWIDAEGCRWDDNECEVESVDWIDDAGLSLELADEQQDTIVDRIDK